LQASEQREQFQRTKCRRRPLKHGKPMIDVPVTKGATVFWGTRARCMTEPATKLSREIPVVAKTGSIGNLAESLTCVKLGIEPARKRGLSTLLEILKPVDQKFPAIPDMPIKPENVF
jgi:hypothetical protein